MASSHHIKITDKKTCSGCRACASICPKQCINMVADDLGFVYPCVDTTVCIECGSCIKVCPFINHAQPIEPRQCFAAVNVNDDERMRSSSGGVFIALAQQTIKKGGVVFGAVFDDNWNVCHKAAETLEDVMPMMGSKYVQSNTGQTFTQTREYLKDGRQVLYTGTPCQIAGLKHFLKTDFPNLLTVEVICHGVPGPAMWQSYLNETINRPKGDEKIRFCAPPKNKNARIAGISFRDKTNGWKKYGFALLLAGACDGEKNSVSPSIYQPFNENAFMKAFLRNWSLRPSCYACKAKNGSSQADLTIGDFWGVENYSDLPDDNRGTSCVIVRSEKGLKVVSNNCELGFVDSDYNKILRGNPSIESSVVESDSAFQFKRHFIKRGFKKAFNILEKPSFIRRCMRFAKRKFKL